MAFAQINHPCGVFRAGLRAIMEHLRPERALVLYGNDGRGAPFVRAAHGVDPETVFTSGEISLELLRQALTTGEPMLLADAMQNPKYANRTSAVLAGIRSVLCAPLHNAQGKSAGLLYADNRIRVGAFLEDHLDWLHRLAVEMTTQLRLLGPNLEPEPEPEWQRIRERGLASFRSKNLDNALVDLETARDMAELWGLGDLRLARTLNDLGELCGARRKTEEAEALLRRSVEILSSKPEAESRDLAAVLNNLAVLLFSTDRMGEAETVFRRALNLWERSDPNAPALVPILSNLATMRAAQDRLGEAIDLCERASQLAQRTWGATHPNTQRCRDKQQEFRSRLKG